MSNGKTVNATDFLEQACSGRAHKAMTSPIKNAQLHYWAGMLEFGLITHLLKLMSHMASSSGAVLSQWMV